MPDRGVKKTEETFLVVNQKASRFCWFRVLKQITCLSSERVVYVGREVCQPLIESQRRQSSLEDSALHVLEGPGRLTK